ncbi:NADP-dependent oxidoreductase domain-containing protein 1 isoform X1 [Loxodonta africana]|uniref:NADP-dependent oxidoreductase domain-containing protein 1 isoform X1 n=1 Tax=Loxodonta africana TaxID=9785 RepID=UPI000C811334|nr:NADP-dependent oxidoreductase domain-containing protein 1 [Loxodonta africana]
MHFLPPGPEALGSRADLLHLGGDGHSEMDMLEDLETLQSEYALPEEERTWLFLKGRSRGLMVEACAHATFFCKLYRILRQSLHENQTSGHVSTGSPIACEELNVGIIGGGHLGKQLARVLLQLVPIPTESLRISTRRPEVLDELQKLGIQCFYQNSYLVNWANVVFLCCLPSQLPNICLEIQSSLEKTCIVYSFVAAIPVPRLKLLLNHTNILRPQYQCAGGITLNIKWLEGVFYAALNICTAKEMSHPRVLQLLSEQFLSAHSGDCGKDSASCPKFQLTDFVSKTYAKNLPLRRPFPWFDLAAVQLKETPFSLRLSKSTALQDHLTHFYCHLFGISLFKDQPEVSTGSPSQ